MRIGIEGNVVSRLAVAFAAALGLGLALVAAPLPAMANETAPAGERSDEVRIDANDPLEDVNRVFFSVNNGIDTVLLRPVAEVYRFVIPGFGRNGIRNFLDNLATPVVFANDVFQGEFSRAGTTAARFGINTTIGIGGVLDPAEAWGLERHSEDFGQTLGVYGVGEGPYLYLPLLGPSPPRDLLGRGVDMALDPINWIGGDTAEIVGISTTVLNVIDIRARNIETLDELERSSIDYYAAVRSLYRQSRRTAIRNGEIDFERYDLPDIDPSDLD
ncbi:MAG: VacJ family lipoprotein [Alphaproteobacteria bacterium]|nr:VacJ family lipoprotein [Alphaproteobacteria bacterium]